VLSSFFLVFDTITARYNHCNHSNDADGGTAATDHHSLKSVFDTITAIAATMLMAALSSRLNYSVLIKVELYAVERRCSSPKSKRERGRKNDLPRSFSILATTSTSASVAEVFIVFCYHALHDTTKSNWIALALELWATNLTLFFVAEIFTQLSRRAENTRFHGNDRRHEDRGHRAGRIVPNNWSIGDVEVR
jgi:hypothetical protein